MTDVAPSDTAKGAIRPIAGADVHRITSGQVVLDLQTAVKELVENALDAGSTNIAVHFKDYGCESLEVVDNGTGLDPTNYESVALKHYTSKLSSFSDLALVRTFGFRGEALSSLCALADVSIHTATQDDAPVGTILQLDSNGRVADSSKRAARQRGTTITIAGLFKSLPVRRKEFEKNLKREYNKAQNLLQAYALITKGVRWSTTNIPKAGRRIPQFNVNSSSGDNYLVGNVASLFGAKVAPTLMPLVLDLTFSTGPNRTNMEDGGEGGETAARVRVEGLISKPSYGSGRTSSDRQFYYINGRPWDAGRVSRAFNEVYKSFNTNQLPFVIADFKLPTDSYDVNVSPDKRTIFLHEESRLIEKVKEGLEALFSPSRATFLVNGASHSLRSGGTNGVQSRLGHFISPHQATDSNNTEHDSSSLQEDALARSIDENDTQDDDRFRHRKRGDSNALEYREESATSLVPGDESSEPDMILPVLETVDGNLAGTSSTPDSLDAYSRPEAVNELFRPPEKRPRPSSAKSRDSSSDGSSIIETVNTSSASWSPHKRQRKGSSTEPIRPHISPGQDTSDMGPSIQSFAMPGSKLKSLTKDVAVRMDIGLDHDPALSSDEEVLSVAQASSPEDVEEASRQILTRGWNEARQDDEELTFVPLDMLALRGRLLAQASARLGSSSQNAEVDVLQADEKDLQENAGIESRDEAQVERILSRVMHKADFAQMEVVGQFNLGFIIARRRSARAEAEEGAMDDLFIVDQHASDEKYNFEQLQETTRIQSQDLIVPRSLELSASDELVAIEHQDTLSKNGFEILVLESGLPGTRIKLLSQPISKTTVFGVKDLEELLYLLRDISPDSESARSIRCSKARSMFASRACRKSIMIGTALSKPKMKSILTNMGTIEQPWNCPHGRPTMRHLACLKSQGLHGSSTDNRGRDHDKAALKQFMNL
nr:mismatch repair protein [Farysia itapuensis]